MTEAEAAVVAEVVAAVVRDEVRKATAGLLAQVATQHDEIVALRALVDAAALPDLRREVGALGTRVAVVEVRDPVPGPPGPPGPPGADGTHGVAGLRYVGVFVTGKTYEAGDITTWDGSSWHCNEPTTAKPGDGSKAWTLMVKRGRDGKDAT